MFDERAGDNAAPKLSGGLSLGPFPAGGSRYPFVVLPERHICGLLIRDGCAMPAAWTHDSLLMSLAVYVQSPSLEVVPAADGVAAVRAGAAECRRGYS